MPQRRRRRSGSRESGYAYLMALFLILVMIIGSQVAFQNMATEGRRDREEETIWRGKQWVRAIRAYYRKKGAYPQTADDLEKGLPDLHFLRESVYKNPMSGDGSWRFIYTNGGGQLIGSVRYASLAQMALLDLNGLVPQPPSDSGSSANAGAASSDTSSAAGSNGSTPNSTTDNSGNSNSSNGASNPGSPTPSPAAGASPNAAQNPIASLFGPATGTAVGAGQDLTALAQLKPTGPVDGPVLGAFLTGVAGTSDQSSVKVYRGGKTYKEWEFIWNPAEDMARGQQQGLSAPQLNPGQSAAAPGANASPAAPPSQ